MIVEVNDTGIRRFEKCAAFGQYLFLLAFHLQHGRAFQDIAGDGTGMRVETALLTGCKMYLMRLDGCDLSILRICRQQLAADDVVFCHIFHNNYSSLLLYLNFLR